MREILFRGKRELDGKWLYGLYSDDHVYETDFPCIMPLRSGNDYEDWSVIRETVGQYTGLTDKNGKKIFEGDILKQKTTKKFAKYNNFEWECYGIVKFGEYDWRPGMQGYRSMGWYVKPLRNISINPPDYRIGNINAGLNQDDILNRYYPYEVIGNIHDNPELLEVQNDTRI